ncbi:hypothetical protein [Orenia marismortui]|uniref:Uncharacterized protein n=1 Tax=Orenia marismortui TaxID=46469 RepID=A0A4R8H117_9FIRM|nr:hypothetical protein [Orenia marismortui]TDX53252.1 hypothetical protein C7959_103104 [Orenia marismortui]
MFMKLIENILLNNTNQTLQQQETRLSGVTFADTLGVITTALGFIADILAYGDLLKEEDDEGPVLPPFSKNIDQEGYPDQEEESSNQSFLAISIFFTIVIIVVIIVLFILIYILSTSLYSPKDESEAGEDYLDSDNVLYTDFD